MTTGQRTLSIVIGVLGASGSCLALADFLLKMRSNDLPIPVGHGPRAFYQSIGNAYSGGFVAGFSLCFSLTLLAVAVGTWFESRRDASLARTGSVQISFVGKGRQG